jgi:flagellar motor switch protein FliM
MSKTLSQWEIDALLNTMSSDDASPGTPGGGVIPSDRTIKLYDFRRPDKFSKEHIRAIQNIHETFARVTASSLSSYLRSTTSVSLSSIEQVVYDEYVHQLSNPTLVNLVELQPLAGRIVVEMNMNLGLAMLDRMMGGPGQATMRRGELTDIEMALLRSLGATISAGLKDGWTAVADLQPALVETVLNADLVQAALPGDIAALLLFEIHTLGLSGTISICVPHPVIEPLMDRLNTQAWFSSSSRKHGSRCAPAHLRRAWFDDGHPRRVARHSSRRRDPTGSRCRRRTTHHGGQARPIHRTARHPGRQSRRADHGYSQLAPRTARGSSLISDHKRTQGRI